MKKTLLVIAAVTALGVAPATAGSLNDPVVTPLIIADDTSASSSSAVATVALLALLLAIPILD